jgi:signal peptidase I (EC 3.4.21.89). Serine peptidase. MEROPS family S26A
MTESETELSKQSITSAQKNKLGEFAKVIIIALVVAVVLRAWVVEPRYIPSGSMEPTLLVNDRVLVDKISYRFHPPQRGDILVFYPPYDDDKAYIKRLIAVGGDRIAIHDGQVFVNQQPLYEPYIAEPPNYELEELVVPPSYLWVMGDNRNNSNDSHVWGFLPMKNVIGKAVLRFFPFDQRIGILRVSQTNMSSAGRGRVSRKYQTKNIISSLV